MVLEAPSRHELVDEQPLLVLEAVPDEPHQVGVRQLPEVVHFSLHIRFRTGSENEEHTVHSVTMDSEIAVTMDSENIGRSTD